MFFRLAEKSHKSSQRNRFLPLVSPPTSPNHQLLTPQRLVAGHLACIRWDFNRLRQPQHPQSLPPLSFIRFWFSVSNRVGSNLVDNPTMADLCSTSSPLHSPAQRAHDSRLWVWCLLSAFSITHTCDTSASSSWVQVEGQTATPESRWERMHPVTLTISWGPFFQSPSAPSTSIVYEWSSKWTIKVCHISSYSQLISCGSVSLVCSADIHFQSLSSK